MGGTSVIEWVVIVIVSAWSFAYLWMSAATPCLYGNISTCL